MYSKASARQNPTTRAQEARELYRKQRTNAGSLRIPANYKGTAFDKNGTVSRTYMSSRSDTDIPDTSSSNIYSSRGLPSPRVLEHGKDVVHEIPEESDEELASESHEDIQKEGENQGSYATFNEETPKEFVTTATNPPLSSKHFPFGHGLGYEELLLLGLILLLSGNEEGGAQELNISQLILTALLFCG